MDKKTLLLVIQIKEALWRKLTNLQVYLATKRKFTFQKRSKKMLLHQRANYADQKHKPQKINMLFKTSQYETSCKNNARLLSQNEEPTRANSTAREKIHWNKHHFGTG